MELQVSTGESLQVSEAVFAKDFNEGLIHQAVTAYLAGGRAGTKAQKNRSDVRGGGVKPWRQKGTGRARAGTIRSPLWRKGGVTFAARPKNYSQKLNKKQYKVAIRAILSELVRQDRLYVVDSFEIDAPKTKLMIAKIAEHELTNLKILLVATKINNNVILGARNIHTCEVATVAELNPVNLIAYDRIVITKGAVEKVQEWLK